MDAVFERLDWLYAGLAVLAVLIPSARHRRLAAAGLGLALLAAAGDRVGGQAVGTSFATINEVLAVLGAAVVLAAAVTGIRHKQASAPAPAPASFLKPESSYPDPWLLGGLALAAAAPHLILVQLGIVLALLAAVRVALRASSRAWLLVLLLGAALTAAALFFLLAIAGPVGGGLSTLPEGPFSPAAERMLVNLLAAGTLLLSGLPPLHRAPWRLALAPLAAIAMVRLTLPVLPAGVEDWQPLAMLLLALAALAAAITRRWAGLAVAAGLASLWSGYEPGSLAGLLLVLYGWLRDQGESGYLGALPRLGERWAGLPALVPALAALPALEAGLRAQVLASVVIVLSGIAGAAIAFARRPGAVQAPLY